MRGWKRRPLQPLAFLAWMEVHKENRERKKVEEAFNLLYSSQEKKKKKNIIRLCQEKAFLQDDLNLGKRPPNASLRSNFWRRSGTTYITIGRQSWRNSKTRTVTSRVRMRGWLSSMNRMWVPTIGCIRPTWSSPNPGSTSVPSSILASTS